MTDKQVDELLDDLDRALDVRVSPSVADTVRVEMASAPRSRRLGMRWNVAAAVAAGVVVAASYAAWNGATPQAPRSVVAVKAPPAPTASASEPNPTPRPARKSDAVPSRVQVKRAQPVADRLDTTPLISSDGRLAMMQMYAAFDHPVGVEFEKAVSDQIETVVISPPITIEPVKIHMVPPIDGTESGDRQGR